MAAHQEQVVPILVGVVAMLLVVSYCVANLGPVSASGGGDYQTGGFQMYYEPWQSKVHGAYHTSAAWDGTLITEGSGTQKYVGFNKTGEYMTSVLLVHNSTKPIGTNAYDVNVVPSPNYMRFSKWWDSGIYFGSGYQYYSVSLAAISAKLNVSTTHNVTFDYAFGWNWQIPWIGIGWTPENYTFHVQTAEAAGAWNYYEYLYHGKFNLTLETKIIPAPPNTLAGMWSAIAWIVTWGYTGWVPIGDDQFAQTALLIFGIIVDVTIVLCLIRIIW